MSRISHIDLSCPKCHHHFVTSVYTEIDAAIDPDLADLAACGTLFETGCPFCDFAEILSTPCLYVDFERNIFVYHLVDPEEEAIALKLIEEKRSKLPVTGAPKTRIVFSIYDFIEKIVIFQADLDDRVMEYAKAQLTENFLKDHPQYTSANCRVIEVDDNVIYFAMNVPNDHSWNSELDIDVYWDTEIKLNNSGYLAGDPAHVAQGWVKMMQAFERQTQQNHTSGELECLDEERPPN